MKTFTIITALGAATLGLTSIPAVAQNTGEGATTTTTYPAQDNDDDSGKWGLVGLLGLAGLLGLKRRDTDHDHRDNTTASPRR